MLQLEYHCDWLHWNRPQVSGVDRRSSTRPENKLEHRQFPAVYETVCSFSYTRRRCPDSDVLFFGITGDTRNPVLLLLLVWPKDVSTSS